MYNPMKLALQKFLFDLLQEHYGTHTQIIERTSHHLATELDFKQFGALIGEIYQLGYAKAAKDYTEKLAELGYKMDVRTTGGSPKDNT
jgi:hypothetical protein